MRSVFLFAVTALIVLGFLAYWSTYTVRFTEVAVVTTFGKADDGSIVNRDGDQAGIHPKWPYPIQSVTRYDTRVRIVQTRSETQLTADDRQIIVESFLTWRVDNPLVFYQRFSNAGPEARDHFREADRTLNSLLRSAMSEVSTYRLGELFAPEAQASRLDDLEGAILARLTRGEGADALRLADYGIEPVLVGINRVVLPEETTREVFERMKATREKIAAEAQSQGEARAQTIRNEADSAARRIIAFAERRAQEIRVAGDREAARWLAYFQEEPELAVFLKNVELLRNGLGRRATLVLPADMPGMELFDPSRMGDAARPPAVEPERAAEEGVRR